MKNIFTYIDEICNKNNVLFFEFGMCDAYHTNIILSMLEQKYIQYDYYGFEPVKSLYDVIMSQKKTCKNGNYICVNSAIGDTDGIVTFYESGGQKMENDKVVERYYGSSSLNAPLDVYKYWEDMTFIEKTAQSTRLDTFMQQSNLQGRVIDFIWADIQGAEVKLIKGGKETFKNVRYFYTEYSNGDLYVGDEGLQGILNNLPDFEILCDYKGDVLLKNKIFQ
jgi:FkbM family methyltransferase